jgi:hypothetical protein
MPLIAVQAFILFWEGEIEGLQGSVTLYLN